jgi:hypothetical protein
MSMNSIGSSSRNTLKVRNVQDLHVHNMSWILTTKYKDMSALKMEAVCFSDTLVLHMSLQDVKIPKSNIVKHKDLIQKSNQK